MSAEYPIPDLTCPVWRTVTVREAVKLIAGVRRLNAERILQTLRRTVGVPDENSLVCVFPLDKNSPNTLSSVLAVRYGVNYYGFVLAAQGHHVILKLIPDEATLGTPHLNWFVFATVQTVEGEPGPDPTHRWPYPI